MSVGGRERESGGERDRGGRESERGGERVSLGERE